MKNLLKTFRVFYAFVTRKRLWFVFFIFVTVLTNALSASLPYFYKLFADAIEIGDLDFLLNLLILMVVIMFFALIAHMMSFYSGDVLMFDASVNARKKIFKHLQDLDFAFHTQKSTGSLISAIKRGDGAMWSLFHSTHHRFLDVIVRFSVMTFVLSSLDIRIMLVTTTSFIVTLFATRYLVDINIKARKRHNDEEDNISSIIVDNLVGFETVKLFARERFELLRLDRAFAPWLKYGWKYVNTFRLIDGSVGSIINISIFIILYYTLHMTHTFQMGVGEFVLVLGFVNSVYPSLWELIYGFRDVGKSYADVEKYFSLLDHTIEVKDPNNAVFLDNIKGEIRYEKLSFSYKQGKKDALNHVNLYIRQGQSIALVGKSGSGKTTLVKLLMRFYDPTKGNITIDGVDIKSMTKSHLRSFIGVVPQEPVLFNNTLAYNIGYGKTNVTKKEIVAAAKMANLHEFIEQLPKGYHTNVGERGIKLSGGQKQRVAIARMMPSDPDIIIFDEATSQLDSENEKKIQDAFWASPIHP